MTIKDSRKPPRPESTPRATPHAVPLAASAPSTSPVANGQKSHADESKHESFDFSHCISSLNTDNEITDNAPITPAIAAAIRPIAVAD
jgi:hypothetical protein